MKKLNLSESEKKGVNLDITDTEHYWDAAAERWVSWYSGYCIVPIADSIDLAYRWVAAGGETAETKDDYEVSLDEATSAAEIQGTLVDGEGSPLSPITTYMVEVLLDGVFWKEEVLKEIAARVAARKKYEK